MNLHYDIDCSHVFLTQFQTRKRVYLFPPDQGKYLYHEPFTVKSQLDVNDPNYEEYPALKQLEGYETTIAHGETLFMPSRYWHHIDYLDGGFSLALRAYTHWKMKVGAASNLATHFFIDKGMNKLLGEKWSQWKKGKAVERAEEAIS
ncbi:MAG: cupin-like domain-containing protein [Owenweeksia sp.]|nr:cupin-like domain-containing protein [Owenweeksia sp.]